MMLLRLGQTSLRDRQSQLVSIFSIWETLRGQAYEQMHVIGYSDFGNISSTAAAKATPTE